MGPLYYRLKQNNYEENGVLLIIILIYIISSFSSYILLDKGILDILFCCSWYHNVFRLPIQNILEEKLMII